MFIQNESEILHISFVNQPLPAYMRMQKLLCNGSALERTFSRNNAFQWVDIFKQYDERCDECLQAHVFVLLPRQFLP